jgi:hypothetical protein
MYIILCPVCGSQEIEPVRSLKVQNTFTCQECDADFKKHEACIEKGEKFNVLYEGELI